MSGSDQGTQTKTGSRSPGAKTSQPPKTTLKAVRLGVLKSICDNEPAGDFATFFTDENPVNPGLEVVLPPSTLGVPAALPFTGKQFCGFSFDGPTKTWPAEEARITNPKWDAYLGKLAGEAISGLGVVEEDVQVVLDEVIFDQAFSRRDGRASRWGGGGLAGGLASMVVFLPSKHEAEEFRLSWPGDGDSKTFSTAECGAFGLSVLAWHRRYGVVVNGGNVTSGDRLALSYTIMPRPALNGGNDSNEKDGHDENMVETQERFKNGRQNLAKALREWRTTQASTSGFIFVLEGRYTSSRTPLTLANLKDEDKERGKALRAACTKESGFVTFFARMTKEQIRRRNDGMDAGYAVKLDRVVTQDGYPVEFEEGDYCAARCDESGEREEAFDVLQEAIYTSRTPDVEEPVDHCDEWGVLLCKWYDWVAVVVQRSRVKYYFGERFGCDSPKLREMLEKQDEPGREPLGGEEDAEEDEAEAHWRWPGGLIPQAARSVALSATMASLGTEISGSTKLGLSTTATSAIPGNTHQLSDSSTKDTASMVPEYTLSHTTIPPPATTNPTRALEKPKEPARLPSPQEAITPRHSTSHAPTPPPSTATDPQFAGVSKTKTPPMPWNATAAQPGAPIPSAAIGVFRATGSGPPSKTPTFFAPIPGVAYASGTAPSPWSVHAPLNPLSGNAAQEKHYQGPKLPPLSQAFHSREFARGGGSPGARFDVLPPMQQGGYSGLGRRQEGYQLVAGQVVGTKRKAEEEIVREGHLE